MSNTYAFATSVNQHMTRWNSSSVRRVIAVLQRVFHIRSTGDCYLKRVETLTLGPKKTIHLFECRGELFLVGDGVSTPLSISCKDQEVG